MLLCIKAEGTTIFQQISGSYIVSSHFSNSFYQFLILTSFQAAIGFQFISVPGENLLAETWNKRGSDSRLL